MKKYFIIFLLATSTTLLLYCTRKDQVVLSSSADSNTLVSYKTTTPPVIDGNIDGEWSKATSISVTPTVPDPGNNLFTGYNGETYPATLRSMYDDQYIYFLLEYADSTKSVNVAPWYFNTDTKLWAQEPTSRTYDVNGKLTRQGHGEDKFAMLWNIDFSTPKFISQTCYASCHVFTPYTDFSVNPPVSQSNAGSGNHYTNGASEKIDMWWAHLSRDVLFNQMDDNYQDWAGGPGVTNLVGGSGNGRHVDGIVVSGANSKWPYSPSYTTAALQGASNNRQSLKLDGTGVSVNVPLWIIPDASSYYYILATDTLPGGKAVKITGVSSTGVLSYNGGSINPNVGTDYQRAGDAVFGGDGAKCFPGYIASPLVGGRADITCSAVYTGTGWVIEFKRKLRTDDTLKQDVDLSGLQDQQFGLAIWNQSNNQHGIQPNLLLKFQR
ncbi:ethylbenzene dehydrogenase-related protein [Niastella vici]|nr:ethylbenzene dehydrogenase-related protein [Niastella vici]